MPFTDVFDVTQPPDTQPANQLGLDIRTFKLDIQQRVAAMSGVSTALPAFGADAQPANWTGTLFFATDNGHIYQWNGAAWVDVTTSFLPSITRRFLNPNPQTFINPSVGGTGLTLVIPTGSLQVGSILEIWSRTFCAEVSGAYGCFLSITDGRGVTANLPVFNASAATGVLNGAVLFMGAVGAGSTQLGFSDTEFDDVPQTRQYITPSFDPSTQLTIGLNYQAAAGTTYTQNFLAARVTL
jgi:hypothetical protein